MAEREGFEPSIRFKTYTPLAGERLQPLGHLSVLPVRLLTLLQSLPAHTTSDYCIRFLLADSTCQIIRANTKLARPEGFEPPTAWFVARYSIQLSYGRVFCDLRIMVGGSSRVNPPELLFSPAVQKTSGACRRKAAPAFKHRALTLYSGQW